MKILALDTTSNVGSIALLENENLIAEQSWENASSHTSVLPIQFQEILQKAKVSADSIDLFAVTKGPGSFTGVRIGLAFIKGLTLLNEKPVMGISTLEAMANIFSAEFVCPLLDAYREQIFGALYHKKGEILESLIEEQAEFPEKFFEKIKELKNVEIQKLLFLGEGAKKYLNLIQKEFGTGAQIIPELPPRAFIVGKLAFNKFKQGLSLLSGMDLSPSYLRGSAAESSPNLTP